MMRSNDGIAGSSATYRKATNEVAKRLKVDPVHTQYPSEDFQDILDLLDEKQKEKAIEWYERGIIRGLTQATNWFLDGTIYLDNGVLKAPAEWEVKVRVKFAGEKWQKRRFKIEAEEIGFE